VDEGYAALTPKQLEELNVIGMRFCSPVIVNADAPETEASESEAEREPAAA
jgi:hypothetical protein